MYDIYIRNKDRCDYDGVLCACKMKPSEFNINLYDHRYPVVILTEKIKTFKRKQDNKTFKNIMLEPITQFHAAEGSALAGDTGLIDGMRKNLVEEYFKDIDFANDIVVKMGDLFFKVVNAAMSDGKILMPIDTIEIVKK